jgi:hypothetical protein
MLVDLVNDCEGSCAQATFLDCVSGRRDSLTDVSFEELRTTTTRYLGSRSPPSGFFLPGSLSPFDVGASWRNVVRHAMLPANVHLYTRGRGPVSSANHTFPTVLEVSCRTPAARPLHALQRTSVIRHACGRTVVLGFLFGCSPSGIFPWPGIVDLAGRGMFGSFTLPLLVLHFGVYTW